MSEIKETLARKHKKTIFTKKKILDLNSLLQNDAVKQMLEKAGIDKSKQGDVAAAALNAVKSKFSENPMSLASLFSANDDTDDDKATENELMASFSNGLQAKGFSMDKIGSLSALLPLVLGLFKGKAANSKDGGFDLAGVAGILGDLLGGNTKGKNSKGGL